MPRNINNRVEVLFPVADPDVIRYLRDDVLAEYMKDNVKTRVMHPDGSYERIKRTAKQDPVNIQVRLFEIRESTNHGN
jgi:polyphosphate kinase